MAKNSFENPFIKTLFMGGFWSCRNLYRPDLYIKFSLKLIWIYLLQNVGRIRIVFEDSFNDLFCYVRGRFRLAQHASITLVQKSLSRKIEALHNTLNLILKINSKTQNLVIFKLKKMIFSTLVSTLPLNPMKEKWNMKIKAFI